MSDPQPKPRRTPGRIPGKVAVARPLRTGPQPDRFALVVTRPDPAPEPTAWDDRLKALAELADACDRSMGGVGLVVIETRVETGRNVLVLESFPAAGWEDRRARTADFLRAAPLGLPMTVELTTY